MRWSTSFSDREMDPFPSRRSNHDDPNVNLVSWSLGILVLRTGVTNVTTKGNGFRSGCA